MLLIWPADRATWNVADRSISLRNTDGTTVTLRDGDVVSVGGGVEGEADPSGTGRDWTAGTDWVSAPGPSCPVEIGWYVGSVEVRP